jgi:hypothetical protein
MAMPQEDGRKISAEMPRIGESEMTDEGRERKTKMTSEINSTYEEILKGNMGEDTPEERVIFSQLADVEIRSGVKTLLIARNGEQPISRAIFLASKGDAAGEVTVLSSSSDEQSSFGQKVVGDMGIKNIGFISKRPNDVEFDQVLISDFFSGNSDWRRELNEILEKNVKRGGSLYIVDKKFGENPECEEIKRELFGALFGFGNDELESKNKININLKWVSMHDGIMVGEIESPMAIFKLEKSMFQNLPQAIVVK